MIDGHNDMPWEIRKQGSSSFDKIDISKPQPKLQTDIPRLRKGGVGVQVLERLGTGGNRLSR